MKKSICIDLDGTLCPQKLPGQTYSDLVPFQKAVSLIQRLHSEGHYIILATARGQLSNQYNSGKIWAKMGYLYKWLEKWDIPFDEIHLKPLAICYIDDRGFRHTDWDETEKFIQNLIDE